jgi:hypothetical protein
VSPWRGPSAPGEIPTLGGEVGAFIETYAVVPDGMYAGEPYVLSDEQREFVNGLYALKADAEVDPRKPSRAFIYDRGGQLVAPQKWGKGPLSAALVIAEAYGPVLFDGWDANGEPVGRPWATPWIQITAVSEDQTANVFRALVPMIQLGSLRADIPDTGETRINLPQGGRIEPVTASARSRLGQRITFCCEDEAHDWTKRNGGRKLADTQRRNLAGMGGRFVETGNAWNPAEESVAQLTFEKESGVFKMMLQPGPGSIRNHRDRMRILRHLYGGSWWVDIERISSEIDNLLDRGELAQAERFFFNRIVPGEDRAFDPKRWRDLARPGQSVPDRERIVIGVDGARYEDALAMVATDIKSGFQWPLGIWEKPSSAGPDYEHPMDEVDGALNDAMERYMVWRVYIDPGSQYANITPLMERWQGKWGEKRIIAWQMNRPKPTCYLIRNYVSAIMTGDLIHDGDEMMARHIMNARRKLMTVYDEDGHAMFVIQKEAPNSPAKIDAAAAGALSWQARGDAIAAGTADPGTYDNPVDKCGTCGHLKRLHVPQCRVRSDDCQGWTEPDLTAERGPVGVV